MVRTLRVRLRFRGGLLETTRRGGARQHAHDASHERKRVIAHLSTRERGLHAVDFEGISGIRRRGISTANLRLSHQGESVAFHVEPKRRRFGPGSTLFFLGDGEAANPYGNEIVYELEIGVRGQRMPVELMGVGEGPVSVYRHRIDRQENRLYQATLVDAVDPWLWDTVFGGASKRFPFAISGLAARAEAAHLSLWLQGGSDFPASPDHHVRVWVNGSLVGEDSWNAKRPRKLEAEVPPGVLRDGENVLEIENVGDTEAAYSMVFVDRWALEYSRQLEAVAGRFEGRFDGSGRATLSNLGTGSYVVDATDAAPRWLKIDSADGAAFRARAGHRYVASSPEAVARPAVSEPVVSRLKNSLNYADYLVIGPSELVVAARPLLTHRQNQGLDVRGVSLEEIYSEFGFGEARPSAIQSFLSYAYHHWRAPSPRYVLLLGDGTYDFKDYLRLGGKRLQLPPFMVKTEFLWTASDPAYAAINGDDLLPDLAIGRLPAASVSELATMVTKILTFEAGVDDSEGPIVLVADDSDRAGEFERDADTLAATISGGRSVEKIYLSQLGVSETRSRVLDAFDSGASLVSYLGHGGINLWADENLLRSRDVSLLSTQPRQPIVLTMNCLNGYFHFPFFDSLSEALLKAEAKGAIATFSPSGLSLHEPASRFHSTIVHELVRGNHVRLGDALLEAQIQFAETGARNELLSIYHLMGDPALVLSDRP